MIEHFVFDFTHTAHESYRDTLPFHSLRIEVPDDADAPVVKVLNAGFRALREQTRFSDWNLVSLSRKSDGKKLL